MSNQTMRWPAEIVVELPGFDSAYYVAVHPDVLESGMTPLEHYLEIGWKIGRDPSPGFSTKGYLAANPDVAAAGHNPLVHYVMVGLAQGRVGFRKNPDGSIDVDPPAVVD